MLTLKKKKIEACARLIFLKIICYSYKETKTNSARLSHSHSRSLSLILIILNLLLADTAGTDSLFWNRNVHIRLICFNLVNLGPSYLDSTKWDKIRFERYRFTYFVCNLIHLNRGFCIFLFILLGFEASRAPFGASIMLISLHFILGFVCYCYVVDLNALQLFFFFFLIVVR